MSSVQSVVRVLLLAENRLLREVLARLLARENALEVVGVAGLSEQVVLAEVPANLDVLLGDFLPDAISSNGTIQRLRRKLPNLKILMFGMDCVEEKFLSAVQHGVTGYMLKDASAAEVATAIRAVAEGDVVCPPKLCRALFKYVSDSCAWKPSAQVTKRPGLTRREQQLVQLISLSLTNKEIAGRLCLSEQTVKNHLSRILRKCGAGDRLEAVEYWRTQGFWT